MGDPKVTLKTIVHEEHVVGYVGKFEERQGKPEVTYWIGKEYWGRGFATKALSEFLSLVKSRPIYARAARDNVASLRVLVKCGFVVTGYETSIANARGGVINEANLELVAGVKREKPHSERMPARRIHVRVRPAIREDITGIVHVSNSSLEEGEDTGFGTPRADQPFTDEARLSAAWRDPNLVRGEEVVVAELDGRVVGVVTLEERGEDLELINIDVPRDLQGRGIGSALVRFVEDRARQEGRRAVTLGTSRNAAGVAWRSLPWWQGRGYRITHEEENAWTRAIGPGVREIRMRKDLA